MGYFIFSARHLLRHSNNQQKRPYFHETTTLRSNIFYLRILFCTSLSLRLWRSLAPLLTATICVTPRYKRARPGLCTYLLMTTPSVFLTTTTSILMLSLRSGFHACHTPLSKYAHLNLFTDKTQRSTGARVHIVLFRKKTSTIIISLQVTWYEFTTEWNRRIKNYQIFFMMLG